MRKLLLFLTCFIIQVEVSAQCPVNANGYYGCEPLCDGYATAMPTPGGFPYTYTWAPGGETTQTIYGLCSGMTYTVYVLNSAACLDSATFYIPAGIVLAFTSPTVVDASCPTCCDGSIMSNLTGGTGPYLYSWSTGETTAGISGLCPGTYSVCGSDQNLCSTCDTINVVGMTTSIQPGAGSQEFGIFPNPTNDIVTITGIKAGDRVEVMNVLAECVVIIEENKIDLSGSADGIYFIRIINENGIVTKKILKE